jgi:transmembrane sensor
MKKNNTNKNGDPGLPHEFEDFMKKASITWDRSKEQVWQELEQKMDPPQIRKSKVVPFPALKYLAVAVVAMLLVSSIVARFYTRTVECSTGDFLTYTLPDGSNVKLNAETEITYRPLWWKMEREVELDGEAFFEVQKGKSFSVASERGQTTVLGTSFNVYARGKTYEVTCVTGKVEVASRISNDAKTLAPKEKAILKESGSITIKTGIDPRESTAWTFNEHFISGSLEKVVEEMERQYGVNIKMEGNIENLNVNISSPRENSVAPILERICLINGLVFEKTGNKEYTIKRK